MKTAIKTFFFIFLGSLAVLGCRSSENIIFNDRIRKKRSPDPYVTEQLTIPVWEDESTIAQTNLEMPRTCATALPDQFFEMSLDDAILTALNDATILRSLSATSLSNPTQITTSLEPAILSTDPVFGEQAALAAFDTNFQSSLLYAKNDDVFNNPVLGGGLSEVREDLATGQFSWSRTNSNGTQFSIVDRVEHLQSNNSSFLFSHSWRTTAEATIRKPLLQGSGERFNQIAGPVNQPGFLNSRGIAISRISNSISLTQFEQQLAEMVREIVVAYWKLDLAYKNYQSTSKRRDSSLKTWNIVKAKRTAQMVGGEAHRESQAQEQYYQFEALLLNALNGSIQTGQTGIYQAEANLRRLLNLPQSDSESHMIRPSEKTSSAGVVFDWSQLVATASKKRVEIREQTLRVLQRSLELEAANNFILPRLDAIATYRNNGFGDDLIGGGGRFSSALNDAATNDHGEWELGFTYDVAVGRRRAIAGVRNAELQLVREKAVIKDQRAQLAHDLGSAIRQMDLNYGEIQINKKRLDAAQRTLDARQVAYAADATDIDQLLEAQRRVLDSQLQLDSVIVSYEIAKEELLVASGDLLQQHGVLITDSNQADRPVAITKFTQPVDNRIFQ